MYKFLSILLLITITFQIKYCFADEALLDLAKTEGLAIYTTCIVTPPANSEQQAACVSAYSAYLVTLTSLNAPYPLIISTDLSPYRLSPYDICKYEVAHIVFGDTVSVPNCPSIPI